VTTSVPPRTVPLTKLSEDLLNPEHRAGGPKSVFFRAFGFSADRFDVMIAVLIAHPDLNPVEQVRTDQWGTRYVARCNVESPDGRNPCILTVWIVPPGQVDGYVGYSIPG
jgi:hypothetical protein